MILIYDSATAALALGRDVQPRVRAALEAELALLTAGEHDLTDWTDILVVEPGDTEEAIAREVGFSPLVDPLSGVRHGAPDFQPGWDLMTLRGGVFRLVFTFGSTHAAILMVPDEDGVLPLLRAMCRRHTAMELDRRPSV